jgi:hypothetical protein
MHYKFSKSLYFLEKELAGHTGSVNIMSSNAIQLTQFRVEKLKCIGGEGRAAPYRITTYRGLDLGSFGVVSGFTEEACNSSSYQAENKSLLTRILNLIRR